MIPAWKKALSYFWEVPVETAESGLHGRLEVRVLRGKLVLDAPHANYSFGSLHTLFRKAFQLAGVWQHPPGSLLLLGLGAGSVAHIIRKEYGQDIPITAVELDPRVIEFAHKYFDLGQYEHLEVVCTDALDFVTSSSGRYGMIVVDLFLDDKVPGKFTETLFLEHCKRLLEPGGMMLFNYIVQSPGLMSSYRRLLGNITAIGFQCREERIFASNRLLILTKP